MRMKNNGGHNIRDNLNLGERWGKEGGWKLVEILEE